MFLRNVNEILLGCTTKRPRCENIESNVLRSADIYAFGQRVQLISSTHIMSIVYAKLNSARRHTRESQQIGHKRK
jgi:hypothetical protein